MLQFPQKLFVFSSKISSCIIQLKRGKLVKVSSSQCVNTGMNILICIIMVHPIFSFAVAAVASAFYF